VLDNFKVPETDAFTNFHIKSVWRDGQLSISPFSTATRRLGELPLAIGLPGNYLRPF